MRPLTILVNLTLFLCFSLAAFSQSAVLLPAPIQQFYYAGLPVSGGTVAFYASGTFTQLPIYADAGSLTQLPNPVTLNSSGYPQNASGTTTPIFLQQGTAYRVVLKTQQGVQLYQVDNVTGLASSQAESVTVVPFSATPVFTATGQQQLFQMTLTGNVTSSTFNAASGLQLPVFVTFELIQDSSGNRSFNFPPNAVGATTAINSNASGITVQSFVWDGTNLYADSPAIQSNGVFQLSTVDTQNLTLGPGTLTSVFNLGVTPLIWSGSGPVSINSGFGTSPTIVNTNGTAAFEINVGTGGTATSGVVGFFKPANNGWSCQITDMSTNIVTRETAFTMTSITINAASAWGASDKLLFNCAAF